jgi:DoxX-like protein
MNLTVEGSGTLSPMDLSMLRSKGIVIGFWTVTALFCLQIGFTAYAQLSVPQVAEAFTHLGFPDYFRVELSWAKLLGVVLLAAGTGVLWGLSYFFWRRMQACLDEAP